MRSNHACVLMVIVLTFLGIQFQRILEILEIQIQKRRNSLNPCRKERLKEYTGKRIPQVLYKTGPTMENGKVSDSLQDLFTSIRAQNPEYEIRFFNDEQSRMFIQKHFSNRVLDAYDALVPKAYKADLWRYCVLYKNGGVYGDLTQKYISPLRELVDPLRDTLVIVRDLYQRECRTAGVQISFMASLPGLPIFKQAIDQIVDNVLNKNYGCNSLSITGPVLFRNILNRSNIPYRLELEETEETEGGPSKIIKWIHTGETAIIPKSEFHRDIITERYGTLYNSRKVYDDNKSG